MKKCLKISTKLSRRDLASLSSLTDCELIFDSLNQNEATNKTRAFEESDEDVDVLELGKNIESATYLQDFYLGPFPGRAIQICSFMVAL